MGDSVVTQVGMQIWGTRPYDSVVTAMVMQLWGPRAKQCEITQIIMEVWGRRHPCPPTPCPAWIKEMLQRRVHRFAVLWKITRTDGEIFYFTDHIGELKYTDGVYTPVGGPSGSAREHESGEKEHTTELQAAIVLGGIELDELEAKKWDGCTVLERVVDWRYPEFGCLRDHLWYGREAKYDGENWNVKLGGITTMFEKKRGDFFSVGCTRDLGDAYGQPANVIGCRFNLAAAVETGAVSIVTLAKHSFRATGLTAAHGSDYFVDGDLLWLTGPNAGAHSTVKIADEGSGYYDIEFEMATVEDIQNGDTFTLGPGCNKTLEKCVFFNQVVNRQAYDYMPGEDGMQVNPNEVGL